MPLAHNRSPLDYETEQYEVDETAFDEDEVRMADNDYFGEAAHPARMVEFACCAWDRLRVGKHSPGNRLDAGAEVLHNHA